ncbi:MAG: hypothetical protein ACW990_14810, partial [Promethearchaeota archaeon]
MGKIKIVYLTGFWYSGATILGRSIKSSKQAIYVGEIRDYWVKGFAKNVQCSCGERFKDCSFWQEVTKEYLKSFHSVNMEKVSKELLELERTKNYLRLRKYFKNKKNKHVQTLLTNYLSHTEKLYEAIAKVSGKNIIIDSSRLPGRLLALSSSTNLEIFPIYLIRDPRGVINSLIKKDFRNYGKKRYSTIRHIISWNAKNLLSLDGIRKSKIDDNVYIWYENFTRHPVKILDAITKVLNWTFNYEDDNGKVSINLEPGHVFTGNRSRNESGKITINEDAKWKKELSWV